MSYNLFVISLFSTVFVPCLAYGIYSQLPCAGFYDNCISGTNSCCEGMSCQESKTGSWNCLFDTPRHESLNKESSFKDLIQDSAQSNLNEDASPHFPCIAKGGNCAATPMACCDDMTCEQDVYAQWFCVPSNYC